MTDDSDFDSNYISEDSQYEGSFGGSSQHSAHSLEMHRNEMNLDDNTNQKEPEVIDGTDEHQSNRTPSDVWKYIDKVTDSENPKCKLCSKIFSAKSFTTTLRGHLQTYHKHIHQEAKQTTLNFSSASYYDRQTNSEFIKFLIRWITIDMLPFSIVDSVYFNDFIKKLNPKFQCPSRVTIKKEIISEFDSRRQLVIDYIRNIPGCCSFTTDIWSSLNNEAFIGVTIHYITNEWKLKHFTLEITQITGSHTGAAICEFISNLLEEFNLKEKILSITTDNGSNMVAACRLLKNDLESTAPNFVHCRCVCHILNLAVSAGIKKEEDLIKRLRKIVKLVRRTQSCLEELKRLAIAADKTFKHPILDVKTRWNSTFHMAQRALDLKEDLSIIQSRNKSLGDIWLDEEEWEKIEVSIYYIKL